MSNSIVVAKAQAVEIEVATHIGALAINTFTAGLTLTEVSKDGTKVKNYSMERGIAFAGSGARKALATSLYNRLLENGRYSKILKDALDGNAVSKGQGEALNALLLAVPAGNEPDDATVLTICGAILSLAAQGKAYKETSQKAYFIGLIREVKVRIEAKIAKIEAKRLERKNGKGKAADSNVIENEAVQPSTEQAAA